MVKVTLKDLARELGVSTTLVSRVLNAPRREDGTLDCDIAAETAERVLEAARRLDYRPSRFAAGLRKGRRYMLGVITPDISNYAFSEACRHIEERAHNDGYSVIFGSSAESATRIERLLDIFIDHGVDGVIVTPCVGCEEAIERIVRRGVPLVLINRDIPQIEGVGRVFLDNIRSMEMVVTHLFENGYRRIEMISENMDVLSLRDRESSYSATMSRCGLMSRVHVVETATQREQIADIVRDGVSRGVEVFITPRIMLSLYSLQAIMEQGLDMPSDITLFCHDESPAFTTHSPSISYVSQCSDRVGAEAYKMVQDMIRGGEGRRVLIEPELHFGDSTRAKSL